MGRKVVAYSFEFKSFGPPHVALNKLGIVLLRRGKPDLAAKAFRRAIKLHPNCAVLYYNLGIALTNLGQHKTAKTAFKRAEELDPNLRPPATQT